MPYKDKKQQRAADLRYYYRNREKIQTNSNKRRKAFRKKITKLKASKPCVDCNTKYPGYVMDFDHIRGKKVGNISELINWRKFKEVEEEIKKCDLVCANCHRIRTHKRGYENQRGKAS